MKILIIRLSAIGDTIHCLPVADAIKRRFPAAQVGWLVEPASAPLLLNNPAVDRVFVMPRKEWENSYRYPGKWARTVTGIGAFWAGIRREGYQIALDMQGLLKSAVCAVISGAPIRVGFAGTREGAEHLLSHRHDAGDYFAIDRHVVDLNLSIVDYLASTIMASHSSTKPGRLPANFPLPDIAPDVRQRVEHLLSPPGAPDKGMVSNVVLIPGTTWPSKVWPTEKWWQLAQKLATNCGCRIYLIGGPEEGSINGEIAGRFQELHPDSQLVDLTGKTSLVDLIPLFQRSQLVIGADTGPLHLAAAVGKPKVLAVHGSSPWLRNGPYGAHCETVYRKRWCQPCYAKHCPLGTNACLTELTVDAVYQAAHKLMGW